MGSSAVRRALLVALFWSLASVAPAQPGEPTADDLFIEALSGGAPDEPVERERLAKLFANVANVLQKEKRAIANLQYLVRVPEPLRDNARMVMESRYEEYASSVSGFATDAADLVEEPYSILRLYSTLAAGQRTCWMLDLYSQLVGTWSGGGAEMRAMLPSRVACGRFRTAAFQPRIEAIVGDALVEQVFQREEINRLNSDLEDLQELVDDLMKIEAGGDGSAD